MSRKNNLLKSIIFALVLFATLLSACATQANANSASITDTSTGSIGTVSTITVEDTIETSGTLDADQLAKLTWNTSGIVDTVYAVAGQQVKQGDILASLKGDSVPANVISAQAELVTAKRNLEEVKTSGSTKAEAEVELNTAQDAYDTAYKKRISLDYKRATQEMIDYAQAQVDLAENNVARAEKGFNAVQDLPPNNPSYASAYTALYNARKQRTSAISTLNWYKGQPTGQDIAEADATLALAKAQLDAAQRKLGRMVDGYDPDELATAQAKVDSAQATVNSMHIIAPFDGEILAVETISNSVVSQGNAAIVMVNRNTLKVEALVDETDIFRVAVGNKARITMDVLPDTTLNGKVVLIDPIGATVSGLVKYTVFVSVEANEQANYFGATTEVTLVTSEPRTMLAVPLGAVQNDNDGEYVLRYKADGSLERVTVQSDTILDDKVSIAGDLKEGDQVYVGVFDTPSSTSSDQRGPGGMFGLPQ